jgi:hypothetical protein
VTGRQVVALCALAGALLAGCGAGGAAQGGGDLRVFAASATETPPPIVAPADTATVAASASPPPAATPTLGPVVLDLDFSSERHDVVTLHVGQAVRFTLSQGPSSDWLSGVDDARVLRPMSPNGNGVFQAMAPGTALVTAHVLYGCANRSPAVPCKTPEDGLWFQMRVWVIG